MGLFGDLLGTVLGGTKKPDVPTMPNVTLDQSQKQAINSNLKSLPQLESLASQTSIFNEQQITDMLNKVIPGWTQTTKTASGAISDLVSGKIPIDVSQAVQNSAAARALTGGFGGSGLAGNLTARDLGLTSLNLMSSGISAQEGWTSMMNQLYSPGIFNLSSMFITPQQEFQDTMANAENQWNVNWLKNNIAAMPDPTMEALGQAIGGGLDFALSTAGAYFGNSQGFNRSSPKPNYSGAGAGGFGGGGMNMMSFGSQGAGGQVNDMGISSGMMQGIGGIGGAGIGF